MEQSRWYGRRVRVTTSVDTQAPPELFTQSVGENRFRHDATRSLYPEMEQVSAVQSRRILS
jgi:hypothetical protein